MAQDEPSIASLERLARSPDLRDRAFVAGSLALRQHVENRARTAAVQALVRETARREHAALRASIRQRALDTVDFIARLRAVPLELRDHWVEEVLDIAYPPLDTTELPRDVIRYTPSGISEILFMLEHAGLDPSKRFLDLGAGLGKVVLLVALLTGARARGIELDTALVTQASAAAQALELENAEFVAADLRALPPPEADVYYMFIPSARSEAFAARVAAARCGRRSLLFAEPLDWQRIPGLHPCHRSSYWLEMYELT